MEKTGLVCKAGNVNQYIVLLRNICVPAGSNLRSRRSVLGERSGRRAGSRRSGKRLDGEFKVPMKP